jgi:hypothetical protein
MFRRIIALGILIAGIPFLSGCFGLIIGAAVGYEVSPDSVRVQFDTSYARAYQASLATLRSMGKTDMEDEKGGWVKAVIDKDDVAVHVEQLTEKTTQVTVSSRRYALPRVQVARDILNRISKKIR